MHHERKPARQDARRFAQATWGLLISAAALSIKMMCFEILGGAHLLLGGGGGGGGGVGSGYALSDGQQRPRMAGISGWSNIHLPVQPGPMTPGK